jgi:SAM-dependent methyltransferase
MSQDALTQARWEDRWVRSEPNYDPAADEQLRSSLSLILRYWPDCRGRFLEAGCGSAANALNLAQRGVEVSGVDLSPEAVRVASEAFEARALRGDFRVADVRDLPFPDESFDFVYAGGVVEHFLETAQAVGEMARVLRTGGRVLLTVPALTLSYPYLFLRGNVPAVPVGEPLIRFIQFRLLRGALAGFGYERSFLRSTLLNLLRRPSLENAYVGRFDTFLPLLPVPRRVRPYARRLARTNLFAPMYFGIATRSAE